jgi:hypothetical protein
MTKIYTNSPMMWFRREETKAAAQAIPASTGVVQGDSPSSTAFNLATLPILDAMNAFRNADTLGYADDLNTVADTEQGPLVVQEFCRGMNSIGLESNGSKFKVLLGKKASLEEALEAQASYMKCHAGVVEANIVLHPDNGGDPALYSHEILGIVHGSPQALEANILKELGNIGKRFASVAKVRHRHTSFQLLQAAADNWIMHLLRGYPQPLTQQLSQRFEDLMRGELAQLMNSQIDNITWKHITLPLADGGLGFTDTRLVANSAYLASVITAIHHMQSYGFKHLCWSNPWINAVEERYKAWQKAGGAKLEIAKQDFSRFVLVARDLPKIQQAMVAPLKRERLWTVTNPWKKLPAEERVHREYMAAGQFNKVLTHPHGHMLSNAEVVVLMRSILHLKSPELSHHRCECNATKETGLFHFVSCSMNAHQLTSALATSTTEVITELASAAGFTPDTAIPLAVKVAGNAIRSRVQIRGMPWRADMYVMPVVTFPSSASSTAKNKPRSQFMGTLNKTVQSCAKTQKISPSPVEALCITPQGVWESTFDETIAELVNQQSKGTSSYWNWRFTHAIAKTVVDEYIAYGAQGLRL